MKKISALLHLILVVPFLLIAGCGAPLDPDSIKAQKLIDAQWEPYLEVPASGTVVDGIRVIEIKAYQFYFEPTTIIVEQGERIRIVVSAEDVPHGFEIHGMDVEGYDIDSRIVDAHRDRRSVARKG